MGSYPILAVNFQLTVNDDEVGIYPAFSELRTLREGREAKRENFSEKTSPELKPKDKRTECSISRQPSGVRAQQREFNRELRLLFL